MFEPPSPFRGITYLAQAEFYVYFFIAMGEIYYEVFYLILRDAFNYCDQQFLLVPLFICVSVLMYYSHYAEVEYQWMEDNLAHQEKRYKEKKIGMIKKAKMTVGFLHNFYKEYMWVCLIKFITSTIFLTVAWYIRFRNENGYNDNDYPPGHCKTYD